MDLRYVQCDVTLDDIDDIELLRKAALLLQEDNKKLMRLLAKLKKELHALKGGDPEQLKLQIADLEQQLAKRNHLLFGDKSEKRGRSEKSSGERPAQTGHGPRAQEVDVVELKYVLKKHRRQKYRCGCGACIETAPGPIKLFPGARYSVGFAINVAIAKYADHLPLERQVKMAARHGLDVDSQTLWDQINALAKVLGPTYTALRAYVLSQPVIGADETTWRLMGAKGKKSGGDAKKWQVWTAAAPDAVCYQIQDSRSTEAARNLLGDYAGTVVCDDYSAYKSLRKRGGKYQIAHCWAHYLEPGIIRSHLREEVILAAKHWLTDDKRLKALPEINDPRRTAEILRSKTRPDDRLFFYGRDIILGFLAQRLPATPYEVAWLLNYRGALEPGAGYKQATSQQRAKIVALQTVVQADACRRVRASHPAAMVFMDGLPEAGPDGLQEVARFCPEVPGMLEQEYHLAAHNGAVRLYLRNDRM